MTRAGLAPVAPTRYAGRRPTVKGVTVTKAKRVTVSLPEDILEAADRAGARERRTRSEVMTEALRWYLRVQELPVVEPTEEEREALAAGRAEHARGETLTHDDILHDLEDRNTGGG